MTQHSHTHRDYYRAPDSLRKAVDGALAQAGIKTYRIQNRITKEWRQVEHYTAAEACASLGWMIGDCYVREVTGS